MNPEILNHPELANLKIIETPTEFHLFLEETKVKDPKKSLLMKEFRKWRRNQSVLSPVVKFFVIFDEEDNHPKNDGWGSWHVYKCVAIPQGKEFEIFKKEIANIAH